jgi:transposase
VAPFLGEHFTLVMPEVNTTCFNIFLEHLAKEYPNKELLLIMDGAGWHRSRNLVIPCNIQAIYLPPYSPELNPVERLWQYIKRWTIRNKIYETVELLEDVVCDFIARILPDRIKTTCAATYL